MLVWFALTLTLERALPNTKTISSVSANGRVLQVTFSTAPDHEVGPGTARLFADVGTVLEDNVVSSALDDTRSGNE